MNGAEVDPWDKTKKDSRKRNKVRDAYFFYLILNKSLGYDVTWSDFALKSSLNIGDPRSCSVFSLEVIRDTQVSTV